MKKKLAILISAIFSCSWSFAVQTKIFTVRSRIDAYFTQSQSIPIAERNANYPSKVWTKGTDGLPFTLGFAQSLTLHLYANVPNATTMNNYVSVIDMSGTAVWSSPVQTLTNKSSGRQYIDANFVTPIINAGSYQLRVWQNYNGIFGGDNDVSGGADGYYQIGENFDDHVTVGNPPPPWHLYYFYSPGAQDIKLIIVNNGIFTASLTGPTNWSLSNSPFNGTIHLERGFYYLDVVGPDASHFDMIMRGIRSFDAAPTRDLTKVINNMPDSGGTGYFDYARTDSDGKGYISGAQGTIQQGTCRHQLIDVNRPDVGIGFVNRGFNNCTDTIGNTLASEWSTVATFPDLRIPPAINPINNPYLVSRQPSLNWGPGYTNPQGIDQHSYHVIIATITQGIGNPFFNSDMGTNTSMLFPHPVYQQTTFTWKVIASNPSWPNTIEAQGNFTIDPDVTPPGNVTDLDLGRLLTHSVDLRWSAPGDDGYSGQAASYDIRYATFPIINFSDAAPWPASNFPQTAGAPESVTVGNLMPATTYYFALKAVDDFGNVSAMSNVVSTRTLFDDPLPPVGSFLINAGAQVVKTPDVQLDISLLDTDSLNEHTNRFLRMAFSSDGTNFTPLEAYQQIKPWKLQGSSGLKKIYVKFMDEAGNESVAINSIFYDVYADTSAPFSDLSAQTSFPQFISAGPHEILLAASEELGSPPSLQVKTPDNQTWPIPLSNPSADGMTWVSDNTSDFSAFYGSAAFSVNLQNRYGFPSSRIALGETFLIDTVPAVTLLSIPGAIQLQSNSYLAGVKTPISMTAADPLINGLASGVDTTEFILDGGTRQPYVGPFTLPQGAHTLSYFSRDRAQNEESTNTVSIIMDSDGPSVAIAQPLGGDSFIAFRDTITIQFSALDDSGAAPTTRAFLIPVPPPPGSIRAGSYSGIVRDTFPVQNGDMVYPAQVPPGFWALSVTAQDPFMNVTSSETAPFEVIHDALPPRSSLFIGQPQMTDSQITYITAATPLVLSAEDDLFAAGDRLGKGVDSIKLDTDYQGYQTLSSATLQSDLSLRATFYMPNDGAHDVSFFSSDVLGNDEFVQSVKISVDNLSPVSVLKISSGPGFYANGSDTYVSTASQIILDAFDPLIYGAASGVQKSELVICLSTDPQNCVTPSNASDPFSLSENSWQLLFNSQDRLGNAEPIKIKTLIADGTPPSSRLDVSVSSVTIGTMTFVSGARPIQYTALDPAPQGIASGVSRIFVSTSVSTPYRVQSSSGFMLAEGTQTVTCFAQDNAGNNELLQTQLFYVDASSPVIRLAFEGGNQISLNGVFYTSSTRIRFEAQEPVSGGAASGFERMEIARDFLPYQVFPDSIVTLSVISEGLHQLDGRAYDRVQNFSTGTLLVALDATPPVTQWSLQGRQFQSGGTIFTSSNALILLDPHDPVKYGVASGLKKLVVILDGTLNEILGSTQPYALSLSTGDHILSFYSVDFTGNAEAPQTIKIRADLTPPISQALVGTPQLILGTQMIIGTQTAVTLSAADGLSSEPGSGLKTLYYTIDQSSFTTDVSATLYLSGGTRTVTVFAEDVLGNLEDSKSLTVIVDSNPPALDLTLANKDAAYINLRKGKIRASFTLVDDFDPEPVFSVFLNKINDPKGRSSIALNDKVSRSAASNALYGLEVNPLTVPAGQWILSVKGQDIFGNSAEVFSDTLTIIHSGISAPQAPQIASSRYLSQAGEFHIQWNWPTLRLDNTGMDITELDHLEIIKLNTPSQKSGQLFSVNSDTQGFVDVVDRSRPVFYKVRAVDVEGAKSPYSKVIAADPLDSRIFMLADQLSFVAVPNSQIDKLDRQGMEISISQDSSAEGGIVFKSVSMEAFSSQTGNLARNVSFIQPIQITFGYETDDNGKVLAAAPSLPSPRPVPIFSVELPKDQDAQKSFSSYWFNGLQWIKLGTKLENSDNGVTLSVQNSGAFQLRLVHPASRPQLNSVYPRTISPNNDGSNDKIFFFYENPTDAPVSGQIFDRRSVKVADAKKIDSFLGNSSVLAWDGTDDSGAVVQGGVYLYKIEIGDKTFTGTVAVAR